MAAVDSLSRPAEATRLAVLGVIRIGALAVAIGATVTGVVYAIVATIGPTVWLAIGDGSGSGTFVDLPRELRLVNAAAFLLAALTVAVMAFLLADLVWRVRRGVRFVPAVSRSAWALAITLAVGSTLAQIADNLGRWSGLLYRDDVDPATVDPMTLPIEWNLNLQTFAPNWALLGLSVVLAVLAYVIRAGERLQLDTDGLV
jgi:hypothetical protein